MAGRMTIIKTKTVNNEIENQTGKDYKVQQA